MVKLIMIQKDGYTICGDCGGVIDVEFEWCGEDKNGKAWNRVTYSCEDCHKWLSRREPE